MSHSVVMNGTQNTYTYKHRTQKHIDRVMELKLNNTTRRIRSIEHL